MKKTSYIVLGLISLGLGVIGIVLPMIGLIITRHILSIRSLTKQEQAEWRESELKRWNS